MLAAPNRGVRVQNKNKILFLFYRVSFLYLYTLSHAVNHTKQLDIQLFRELVTNRLLVGMAPVESLYLSRLIARNSIE